MANISLSSLEFDRANPDDGANVGAHVRSSDGTLITHTTEGSNERLDVSADLALSDATSIGIYVEDAAGAGGENGQFIIGRRQDADTSPVSADGDYHGLIFDDGGRLKVDSQVTVEASDAEYAQDSALSAAAVGLLTGAYRQDTLASDTSADGDFNWLKQNSLGELYTTASLNSGVADDAASSENPIPVSGVGQDLDSALSALSAADDKGDITLDLYRRVIVNDASSVGGSYGNVSVTTTATQLDGTKQNGRNRILIQNDSVAPMFVGFDNTVTTSNGMRVAGGTTMALEISPSIDVYAIAGAGTRDARVMQMG